MSSWKLGKSTYRWGQVNSCRTVVIKLIPPCGLRKIELKESTFLGGGGHHSSHKDSTATITPSSDSRSTTPTPGHHATTAPPPHGGLSNVAAQNARESGASTPSAAPPTARSGLLKIRVTSGKNLRLPDGGMLSTLRRDDTWGLMH